MTGGGGRPRGVVVDSVLSHGSIYGRMGQQVLYIGSYCIILTVLCGIPMYNIVWAMLTVWDNWFLK